ncbi:MAG: hypothetical protein ABW298_15230 [Candidatus Binatia bacterium]
MPYVQRVLARRDPGETEAAVSAGPREERVVENRDPSAHPGVHVAAHRHHHLGGVDVDRAARTFEGQSEVQAAGVLSDDVHVVKGRVAVEELDGLAGLCCADARRKGASPLIDAHDLLRPFEDPVLQAPRDVHEGVLDSPGADEHVARVDLAPSAGRACAVAGEL